MVQRRAVLARISRDGEEVVLRIAEHNSCRRQVVEHRVVEDRIERELDKPIFALEVTAAASVPVLMLAAAAIDSGDGSDDGATEDGTGHEPITGGALLALTGVALTAVIVDALAARDETKRRTETDAIGFATVDCGTSPANGVRVELVLPDGSRFDGKTDASGVARVGIAMNPSSWVDIVVAGKLAGRVLVGDDTTSRKQPP